MDPDILSETFMQSRHYFSLYANIQPICKWAVYLRINQSICKWTSRFVNGLEKFIDCRKFTPRLEHLLLGHGELSTELSLSLTLIIVLLSRPDSERRS